jgi:DNA-binding transcriptional ArsR family regulator
MIDKCISFFKAISDKTRQRVVELLGGRELSVNDVARELKLTQPNVSHHLGVLKRCGCVRSRRDGKNVFYSVNKDGMVACCGGFFGRFKIKVEKK